MGMNKTTEALKLAGEALGRSQQHLDLYHPEWVITRQQNDKALAAIREALVQPANTRSTYEYSEHVKQEPVAWVDAKEEGYEFYGISYLPVGKHHLYAAPVDAKAIRAEALEEAAKVAESVVAKQSKHINDGKPFYANMYWEEIAAAIRGLK